MKHCGGNFKQNDNMEPVCGMNRPDCNRPIRRHLPPVLVARVFNQPIIEEIPHSSMRMNLDNTTTISDVHSEPLPFCSDVPTLGGRLADSRD